MIREKKPHYEVVAEKIIEQLEAGTAPWLKPWSGSNSNLPHNPVSGSRYRGANLIWLAARQMESGYTDTRWLTYKQGQSVGAQVRRGEKGTIVQYWQFSDRRKAKDQSGKDIIGNDGKPIYEEYKLQRPRVFSAVVFNASQFDNMPEITIKKIDFNPCEKAEEILVKSGAKIFHTEQDRAFYFLLKDEIHLPDKSQFTSEASYYSTALHELGHWTGHESRLNRKMEGGFGTQEYAKEELRAEITSMMLSEELGIGHDPGQHVSYIKSWIQVLREDPKELFRAAADAEKMTGYVMGLGQKKEKTVTLELPSLPATKKTYIYVAYKEKDEVKRLGARWDKNERSWYVPQGADLSKFERWKTPRKVEVSPVQQFKKALEKAGLVVDKPKMDGKFHRVPVLGETKGKSGSYKAYLDGHPAGYIENFKTGLKLNWKADGAFHSKESLEALSEENLTKRRIREKELEKQYEIKSEEVSKKLTGYKLANEHPYLAMKLHSAHEHLQDEKGNLVIPIHDMTGKVWGLQKITETGKKFFEKNCNITGHFHSLGKFNPDHKTYIAEGLATALSIQKAVGSDANVVVAFVANNLPHVAQSIANHQKGSQIIVCGDDDHKTEQSLGRNPGREKALEAATKVGGIAIFPKFQESEKLKGLTDFNDLEVSRGLAVVKSILKESRGHQIER